MEDEEVVISVGNCGDELCVEWVGVRGGVV